MPSTGRVRPVHVEYSPGAGCLRGRVYRNSGDWLPAGVVREVPLQGRVEERMGLSFLVATGKV